MDGTLLDSMGHWRRMCLDFLRDHDLAVPEDLRASLPTMVTEASSVLFAERFAHLGMTAEDILADYARRMAHCYRTEIEAKPGALAYLAYLRAQGIPYCVATMTGMDMAAPALARHGMLDGCAFALCTHDLGFAKSDPACFAAIAARLGVAPCECAVFEDALYAMEGAARAGCQVYAVADAYSAQDLDSILRLCTAYIDDYRQLLPSR